MLFSRLKHCRCLIRDYSSSVTFIKSEASLTKRELEFPFKYQVARQAWLENLDTIDEKKLGLLEHHPQVFAVNPRIDILHANN